MHLLLEGRDLGFRLGHELKKGSAAELIGWP